ncbi:hypothetical protein E1I69_20325 [Bacillus timonensis]|uniref:Holin n=1 Tax=Bacillus timonensis TaxID=1033734 RepID=A0A4S3PKN4_9BACI|nr:hypothetical protein [Bacillus timonensis]THE09969.1 hypothetical protein E1I69_20325 [Bacillus timonensis]
MEFPTIHTNFWDAVIAVPFVMIITQISKKLLNIPKKYVPTLAILIGLLVSVFYSHRHDLAAGLFMGWFYGSAAIGSYASLKTTIVEYRKTSE